MNLLVLILMLISLAACSSQEPQVRTEVKSVPYEVKIPYYIKPTPPGELMRRYSPTELPQFSEGLCLTPDNFQRLQVILRTLVTREQAWINWAGNGQTEPTTTRTSP